MSECPHYPGNICETDCLGSLATCRNHIQRDTDALDRWREVHRKDGPSRDEVIEECARSVEKLHVYGGSKITAAIRALKTQVESDEELAGAGGLK